MSTIPGKPDPASCPSAPALGQSLADVQADSPQHTHTPVTTALGHLGFHSGGGQEPQQNSKIRNQADESWDLSGEVLCPLSLLPGAAGLTSTRQLA